jgi:hypothetical protein
MFLVRVRPFGPDSVKATGLGGHTLKCKAKLDVARPRTMAGQQLASYTERSMDHSATTRNHLRPRGEGPTNENLRATAAKGLESIWGRLV